MGYYYPDISPKEFNILLTLAKQHEDYFTSGDCPYNEAVAEFFVPPEPEIVERNVVVEVEVEVEKPIYIQHKPKSIDTVALEETLEDLESTDVMLAEVKRIYIQLQTMGSSMTSEDASSAEKNTYFKLSTTLLEKLLGMQERIINIKTITSQIDIILEIMESEVPVDVRNSIMSRLRKVMEK